MGGETLKNESGEREVSATGQRAEHTYEREILWSRTLNLLPGSLAVTRKGPLNFRASLQDRSGERFMTKSPTSRVIGVSCKCYLWDISSPEAFSFSRTEA